MLRHGRTVTILRSVPGGTDRYGDLKESTTVRIDVDGCAVAPRTRGGASTGEILDRGRNGVIEGLTAYLPAGNEVLPTDKVEVDGRVYDVEGEPGVWANPYTGGRPGVEVALRRSEG